MRLSLEYIVTPKDGERVSGDAVFVQPIEEGTIFAVVDALGHGERAAETAHVALQALTDGPQGGGIRALVEHVHTRMRGTRGAAAMICKFYKESGRIEGCCVGNVDLATLGTRVQWLQSPGILGAQLGRMRIFDAGLSPNDRLVVFSDGISPRFDLLQFRGIKASETCVTLMTRQRRSHDDSTVLVADIEP